MHVACSCRASACVSLFSLILNIIIVKVDEFIPSSRADEALNMCSSAVCLYMMMHEISPQTSFSPASGSIFATSFLFFFSRTLDLWGSFRAIYALASFKFRLCCCMSIVVALIKDVCPGTDVPISFLYICKLTADVPGAYDSTAEVTVPTTRYYHAYFAHLLSMHSHSYAVALVDFPRRFRRHRTGHCKIDDRLHLPMLPRVCAAPYQSLRQ